MDFAVISERIKAKLSDDELRQINSVSECAAVNLAAGGDNDTEGYQIFTPQLNHPIWQ